MTGTILYHLTHELTLSGRTYAPGYYTTKRWSNVRFKLRSRLMPRFLSHSERAWETTETGVIWIKNRGDIALEDPCPKEFAWAMLQAKEV